MSKNIVLAGVTYNGVETITAPLSSDPTQKATFTADGIIPTGNINITDTNSTNVTNYATAQVVDSNLVAGNIKKDVSILGVTGSYEGSGGGVTTHTLTFNITNGQIGEGNIITIYDNQTIELHIEPNANYAVPWGMNMSAGANYSTYQYDALTGIFKIGGVTTDITFTASCPAINNRTLHFYCYNYYADGLSTSGLKIKFNTPPSSNNDYSYYISGNIDTITNVYKTNSTLFKTINHNQSADWTDTNINTIYVWGGYLSIFGGNMGYYFDYERNDYTKALRIFVNNFDGDFRINSVTGDD